MAVSQLSTYERVDRLYNNFETATGSRSFFIYDIERDIAKWSPNAISYFRIPSEYVEAASNVLRENIHQDDLERLDQTYQEILTGNDAQRTDDFRMRNRNGTYVNCSFKVSIVRDYTKKPIYLACTVLNRELDNVLDSITDLPSQYDLLNDLRSQRVQKQKSVLVIFGTTNFGDINKLYGYTFGNQVLKNIAEHLVEITKGQGKAYRGTGTTFLFHSTSMSEEEAVHLYERMQGYGARAIYLEESKAVVELGGGLVIVDDFRVDEHSIYSCAQYALEQSETKERGALVTIRNDSIGGSSNTLAIINQLRVSIMNHCKGFYLAYQPLVSSENGLLSGMEVLLRYQDEKFGEVPPDLFMPGLEKDTVFFRLGYWIIEQACTEGQELLGRFPNMTMHLNLTYMQLEQPEFRHSLLSILQRTSFPGRNLCIELSERCKTLGMKFLKEEIIFMKSCGIQVALDGSCMTSLNLIRELPVDMLKIDRDLVSNIETSAPDQYLLEAVTGFATKMNIKVCIQGVENEKMKKFLEKYPSTEYQGYYYSEPVRIEEFKQLPIAQG